MQVNSACILCFCCIFLFLFAFTMNSTDMIIAFHQLEDCRSYLIVIKMAFSCFQKLLGNCILLFNHKRFKFWFSVRYTMIDGMSPVPKIRGRWWVLNCYNSRGLVFSEILGGEGECYISFGAGTFSHISSYIRI